MSALATELAGIDLGDRRLNRRAQGVLTALGNKPTASIPAACGGWDETRAAYRLFDQAKVTPDRVPLGLLASYTWVREPGSLGQEKDPNRPLEEKESVRWVDGFAHVNALAEQLAETRLTYIADREGDIYDLFVEAPCPERGADWLVRVQHRDRVLVDERKLRNVIDAAPVLTRPPS